MVEIVIPRPPSVNRLWRIGKGRMFRSHKYTDWMNECMMLVKEAGIPAIKGKYKMMLRVARPDKRRRDIDNMIKAASDFLQHAGIIEDDCLCEAVYCKWVSDGSPIRINIYPVRGTDELSGGTAKPLQGRARKNTGGSAGKTETPSEAYARVAKSDKKVKAAKGWRSTGKR